MGQVVSCDFGCPEHRECDDCGAMAVTRRTEEQRFTYGAGSAAVELTASLPVWRCNVCGSAYADEEGEAVRHAAVCEHLKVLTPAEVRSVRGTRSRHEFYELTGIAEASMKRWESGEQIQTIAMDTLLRLLRDPIVLASLLSIRNERNENVVVPRERFRTSLSHDVVMRSKTFQLRMTG